MKPRLFLIKRSDGLYCPANDNSSELSKKVTIGDPLEVKVSSQRILWYHKRFFIAVKFIYENMPENFTTLYPTEESLRKGLLLLAGHTEKVHNPDGTFIINVRSMNFETVKQDEFQQLYSAIIDAGLKYFISNMETQTKLIDLT